ncbi:MAG: hypothetical protein GC158_01705 [Cyanobacteria bacterium RI_101]|nr:hypothetical protein [Cyanobacteria bacterium RI_101]
MDFEKLLKSLKAITQQVKNETQKEKLVESHEFQLKEFLVEFIQAAKIDLKELLLTDVVELPRYTKDLLMVKKRLDGHKVDEKEGLTVIDAKTLMRVCDGLEIKGFRKSTKTWNQYIHSWIDCLKHHNLDFASLESEIVVSAPPKSNGKKTKNQIKKELPIIGLKPRAASLFMTTMLEITEKNYQGLSLRDYETEMLNKSDDLPKPTEMRRISSYILSIVGYDTTAILKEIEDDENLEKEIQQVKALIKMKYNNICVITGKKVSNLDAHHLYPVDTHKKLATNYNNLIPISQTLHRAYHKWAKLNKKGKEGLGDYNSFWEFVDYYYNDSKIKNNIQNIKKQFSDPLKHS